MTGRVGRRAFLAGAAAAMAGCASMTSPDDGQGTPTPSDSVAGVGETQLLSNDVAVTLTEVRRPKSLEVRDYSSPDDVTAQNGYVLAHVECENRADGAEATPSDSSFSLVVGEEQIGASKWVDVVDEAGDERRFHVEDLVKYGDEAYVSSYRDVHPGVVESGWLVFPAPPTTSSSAGRLALNFRDEQYWSLPEGSA